MGELVAQEQVLGDQVGPVTQRGTEKREEQSDEFEHVQRMDDPEAIRPLAVPQPIWARARFCRPTGRPRRQLEDDS